MTGSVSFYANPALGETAQTALSFFKSQPVEPFTLAAIIAGGATSIALLLFIGAAGKSAQIPLYVWLPDAMAGPTPVSALIHAATMVTAGVYMIVRCSEISVHAPTAMFVVAIVGAATALFAATIGLAQNDIKKVLAYSTVSQLGYMFLACGVGAFVAAIFHVITHAFFKALLFLGSGSVIHGMHHEQDMRRMGGLQEVHAGDVYHDVRGLAGDLRYSDLGGVLLERRDSLEDVERRGNRSREQDLVGRRRDHSAADRDLHDAHDGDDVLEWRAVR